MRKGFYVNTFDNPVRPWTKEGLKRCRKSITAGESVALDIGAGSGADTVALLRAGFKVYALDKTKMAFGFLKKNVRRNKLSPPKIINRSIESFLATVETKFDFINSSYTLPFIRPDKFMKAFRSIRRHLKPGGIMAVNLFGNFDSWNTKDSNLTFLKKAEAKALFKGLKILSFKEWKNQGRTAMGEVKIWHIFGIVAERPTKTKRRRKRD